jgi:predicted integral membrane protein DUF2269
MQWLFPWFLFLHVLAAIVAFGQPFGYGIIGAMAGREPQHANFGTRITQTLSDRLVIPLALTMPVTGAGMILVNGINLASPQYRWLGAAIVIYVVVVAYAVLVQRRTVERLIALTSAPPPAGASGPPPEVPAVVGRVRRGGMFLAAGIVVILFLMVVKPGLGS